MRNDFARYVELANKGAQQLGFKDNGALWRSKYDMPPDDFAKELDRLWEQVKPLYLSLHAYTRKKLRAKYGDVVPEKGPIPAYLLGNMWAQDWSNIYPLLAPAGADPGYDLTQLLKKKNTDWKQMVKYGEGFFTSLGFDPLPDTFWERSLFQKPRDRDVVCHASAWDIDFVNDLRIKLCIQITGEDFLTIHHELGHNFYQRAYNGQPYLFRDSANDGFHEAVGDTIALSVTPAYLVKLGLLTKAPDPSKDLGLLLQNAQEKIAFLPFALEIDQWRWKVFLRGDFASAIQPGVVGSALEVSGDCAASGPQRAGFRSGSQVSRRLEHAVHALLFSGHPAVPVSPIAFADGGLHRSAQPLLDLRQQSRGREAELDAADGAEPAVAGRAGADCGNEADGRHGDSRLFRAAAEVAGRAESGNAHGLVTG